MQPPYIFNGVEVLVDPDFIPDILKPLMPIKRGDGPEHAAENAQEMAGWDYVTSHLVGFTQRLSQGRVPEYLVNTSTYRDYLPVSFGGTGLRL